MTDELYCVSVRGPDDLIACRDYLEAVRLAQILNGQFSRHVQEKHHPYDPLIWASPGVWPYDEAGHAANVTVEGGEDYATTVRLARAGLLPISALPPATQLVALPDNMVEPLMFRFSLESDDPAAIAREHGFEVKWRELEGQDEALYAEYLEDAGNDIGAIMARWQPEVPEGFAFGGKWDTDDGPIALFLKPVPREPRP